MYNDYDKSNLQQAQTMAGDTCANQATTRRPTPAEEHEKRIHHHYAEAERNQRAASFFREHPEFSDFIDLIRQGIISI